MPIRPSLPPEGALAAVTDHLGAQHSAARAMGLEQATSAGPAWSWPHPIYVLGLDAILAGHGLDAAQPVGWRFLSGGADQPAAVAAEAHGAESDGFRFGALNYGPFNGQMVRLIEDAGAGSAATGDFEPRLLRVPGLQSNAVWLKDRVSGGDILIAMRPSNPALTPGRSYTAEAFVSALAEAARALAQTRASDGLSAP
jgi:hypothetical protein